MVAELARVTVTWGRAAPEGSVTAPPNAPVVADWQWEGEGEATARRGRMRGGANSLRRGGGHGKAYCNARATGPRREVGSGTRGAANMPTSYGVERCSSGWTRNSWVKGCSNVAEVIRSLTASPRALPRSGSGQPVRSSRVAGAFVSAITKGRQCPL